MQRYGECSRKTGETDIMVSIDLDGMGNADVKTGIGFFDHMLNSFAKHGLFDLSVRCIGDLDVDSHHTVEDVGICLGAAIRQALGNKKGITRFSTFYVPMDEALVRAVMDISGRPYLKFTAAFTGQACGTFDVQLTEEFFRGLAMESGITMHIEVLYGQNDHHMIEGIFKAFARSLDAATRVDGRIADIIPSTKGVL